MNVIDSRHPFQHESIVGVSLLHDLQRSSQNNSNVDINKDRQEVFQHRQTCAPPGVPIEIPALEIVGTRRSNPQISSKHVYSSVIPKCKLTRVDQTILQLPKRLTNNISRKAHENFHSKTRSSYISGTSDSTASDKLQIISSSHRLNPSAQDLVEKSSMTILGKTPTSSNQTSPRLFKRVQQPSTKVPLKLPPLTKKPPSSITKAVPSAYIQKASRFQTVSATNSNRPVLQPTPILPIFTSRRSVSLIADQQHLPLIKDRMIQANLAQKTSLKCKSPPLYRSDSSLSRSTTAVHSTNQPPTKSNNPLKHMVVGSLLSEADRNKLKRLFQQFDTDRDGHLTYSQVQKCLPSNLPRPQETFFRVLYDITSESTYFGLQEFFTTAVLVDMISEQDPYIWNSLLDDVDFNYYREDILELLDEFDKRYSPVTSTINFDNLVALIMNRTTNGKYEQISKELETLLPRIKTTKLNRLEFIALIPIVIYIESYLDRGKALFRFKDNSILDLHIQRALLS
ncbi:unnamed protein product [Adineta ricciae]|uniref:EF-hand domain-containing protein n=1 Tax=Adineta ricciae TaxID=249248 RepID=A0A814CPW7_ADIRI|nr:unnamed protein product [Adineta ricciae]